MEFVDYILNDLNPVINMLGLKVIEKRKNYLKFQSVNIEISISHNPLENSNSIWFCRNAELYDSVEIDDYILNNYFNSNLKINQSSMEMFSKELEIFFIREAKDIIMGDDLKMIELEKFDLKRSEDYTKSIESKQRIKALDAAWKNKKFEEYIKLISQFRADELPASYFQKYKIALKK